MPKKIKVIVNVEIELPDKAEVIRFKDEEGDEGDYIKFMGRLFRPNIDWLQYYPSDFTKKLYRGKVKGISWSGVDDDTFNKYFAYTADGWYLEEQ
ncbi:MAG TPA: hypothetical protein VN836_01815 [Verrucomicrobiae bacterium]|nr:hypothetical protein [Verrucomicrobiae bacterium]